MSSTRKRYILLAADGNISADDRKKVARYLEHRHGKVTVIPIEEIENKLIVKTSAVEAVAMRDTVAAMEVGGMKVVSVLTSGCIGKLKRRAAESVASDLAKVSQR